MPFKKGQKRPVNAGRKKGTPNKENQLPREIIRKGLIEQGDRAFKELSKLKGKEYIECYEKLMKYILPQLKAIEHSGNEDKPQSYNLIIKKTYLQDDNSDK